MSEPTLYTSQKISCVAFDTTSVGTGLSAKLVSVADCIELIHRSNKTMLTCEIRGAKKSLKVRET